MREVLVDRGAQVVLERVRRLEQRRPVEERQPAAQRRRAPTARRRTGVSARRRSVSAWSIAAISTRGATICASIATAAADRPSASCRRRASSTGSIRRIQPRLAVAATDGRGRRRGRPVGQRRLVRAAPRPARSSRSRSSAVTWLSSPPSERVAVDCTPAQLGHHTVAVLGPAPTTAAATSRSSSRRSASGARSSWCRARSSASSRSRSSPCASSSPPRRSGRSPAGGRPAPHELRDGIAGRRRAAARLRAPDDRPPVHELRHLGVHHLPARRVRARPRRSCSSAGARTR